MESLFSLRAVLVTGKGGVGKTTLTAALARAFAAKGKRTLAAEMTADDVTVSALGAALGVAEVSDVPTSIDENLSAVLLAPTIGHQKFLRDVLPMKILADAAMRSSAIRRFLLAAPSFPEMGVLYRLLDLVRERRKDGSIAHESIVVDLPATGHALALAQIPQSLLRVIPVGPIATAVREGLDLLLDPTQTGAVIVTLPETLPVSEALELARGIEQHRIPLKHAFLNRIPEDPFTQAERASLTALLALTPPTLGARMVDRIERSVHAKERFSRGIHIPLTCLSEHETSGPDLVKKIAHDLAERG